MFLKKILITILIVIVLGVVALSIFTNIKLLKRIEPQKCGVGVSWADEETLSFIFPDGEHKIKYEDFINQLLAKKP